MKNIALIGLLLAASIANAQPAGDPVNNTTNLPYSQQLTLTAMKRWPDSFSVVPGRKARWSYDQGVSLRNWVF